MKCLVNIGDKFGRLTVVGKERPEGSKRTVWVCRCDCGNEKKTDNLRRTYGGVLSCGCLYNETHGKELNDITGQVFGRLTVVSKQRLDSYGKWLWECQCSCGNKHIALASPLKSGLIQSCGCQKAERLKDSGGSKHWNWQGGKTPTSHAERTACYIWRGQVFKRDDYTCQCCGKKGGQLNAHHLESFHANPDLRTDLDNGITLCVPCYGIFHKRYGKLNNTKEQFEEYKKSDKT